MFWKTNFEKKHSSAIEERDFVPYVSWETRDRVRDFIHGEIFIDSRPRLYHWMHRPCIAAGFQEIHYLLRESPLPCSFGG